MGACILVSTGAARHSKRAMVWASAQIAKSYSLSLRERCRLTPLHAYSVTGSIAPTPCFSTEGVLRACTRPRSIALATSYRLARCWPYTRETEAQVDGNRLHAVASPARSGSCLIGPKNSPRWIDPKAEHSQPSIAKESKIMLRRGTNTGPGSFLKQQHIKHS